MFDSVSFLVLALMCTERSFGVESSDANDVACRKIPLVSIDRIVRLPKEFISVRVWRHLSNFFNPYCKASGELMFCGWGSHPWDEVCHFWRKLYIFGHCSTKSRYPTLLQKHLEYAGHCRKEKSRIEWRHEKQNFKTRSSSSWKMTEHFESHIFQLHYCTPHTWPNGFWLCCSGSCCWCDWPPCCSAGFCPSVQARQEIWRVRKFTYNHEVEHWESKEDCDSGWTLKCTPQIATTSGLKILCVSMIGEE